jgi:hypothetical protein
MGKSSVRRVLRPAGGLNRTADGARGDVVAACERSLLAPPSFRHQREHPRAEEHQGSGLGNG